MKYNDVFLDKEFPAREALRREAVKSAGEIRELEDRLNRIESLARHAIAANPRDLEETWYRIQQIAGTEGS